MGFLNKIDEDNNCIDCIIVNDEDIDTAEKTAQLIDILGLSGNWVVADRNYNGGYYETSIGRLVFPRPHASFILDEENGEWIPPVPHPQIAGVNHAWDESKLEWVVVSEVPSS
jgi:hypothetical protein